MKSKNPVQLLINAEDQDHAQAVTKLLRRAKHLECLVAFAKISAGKGVMKELETALKRGLTARFAIGLDFCLTTPALLRRLWKLSQDHKLELKLYLSNGGETFHPKIYAFKGKDWCSVLIGSANLTHGGLSTNYEASAMIDDATCAAMDSIVEYFDNLIDRKAVVLATKRRIDAYEREYIAHDSWRKVAKKRAEKLSRADVPNYSLLRNMLALMKEDNSEEGFDKQNVLRTSKRHEASKRLFSLAAEHGNELPDFLQRYEALIGSFHSGGLQRGKTRVAEHPNQFVAAVADIVAHSNDSPGKAFDILLQHFREVPGAGINIMTEILHTLDNKRFAVMNQNAVSGMMRAGITGYPLHPAKETVNPEGYERYCQQADAVRRELGLADFTELDALFNYAYWAQKVGEDES